MTEIRFARMEDLKQLVRVEAACFPEAEAAAETTIADRLRHFPNHFWVMTQEESIIGFINGMVTDECKIRDELFADASLHREDGAYQSVFGLDVLPQYRRKGYGAVLLQTMAEEAWRQGRAGCILTCKERLIPYYKKNGYQCLGVSQSVHGGAVWYDMLTEPT